MTWPAPDPETAVDCWTVQAADGTWHIALGEAFPWEAIERLGSKRSLQMIGAAGRRREAEFAEREARSS